MIIYKILASHNCRKQVYDTFKSCGKREREREREREKEGEREKERERLITTTVMCLLSSHNLTSK